MRRPSLSRRATLSLVILLFVVIAGALIAFAQDNAQPGSLRPASGSVSYTIEIADTLDTIGQAYDVTVRCLVETNGIENPMRIFPGDTLTISADCPHYDGLFLPAREGQGGGPNVQPGPGDRVYLVVVGDNLDLIAASFDVQLRCLIETNQIESPLRIFPGDLIVIPSNCPPYDGLSTAQPRTALSANELRGAQGSGGGGQAQPTAIPLGNTVAPTAAQGNATPLQLGPAPTQAGGALPTQETFIQATPLVAPTAAATPEVAGPPIDRSTAPEPTVNATAEVGALG
jgi:LysM repeat protein